MRQKSRHSFNRFSGATETSFTEPTVLSIFLILTPMIPTETFEVDMIIVLILWVRNGYLERARSLLRISCLASAGAGISGLYEFKLLF